MTTRTKKPEGPFEILYRDFMKGVSMKALNARIQNSKKNAFRYGIICPHCAPGSRMEKDLWKAYLKGERK